MNERIQELMKQSMVEYQFDLRFSPEKFAELIVRECAKIAEDTQKFYDEHNDSQVNTEIWTMIKLHFGVRE